MYFKLVFLHLLLKIDNCKKHEHKIEKNYTGIMTNDI